MVLTTRTNGSGPSNIIQASWWNDFLNLLTGAMQDQKVTIQNNVVLKALGTTPSAPSLSHNTGSTLGVGVYTYAVSFVSDDGESLTGTTQTVTTTSGSTNVSITSIPTGPTGTTGRNVYRSKVNNSQLYLLHAISDNTTTIYTDSTADSSLSILPPDFSSFGGSLVAKDSSGTIQWRIYNDGHFKGGRYYITPYKFMINSSISSGNTSTFTLTGGSTGVPNGAAAVIVSVFYDDNTIGGFLGFTPHGTTWNGNYPIVGTTQITGAGKPVGGTFDVPLDANGQIDVSALSGSASNINAAIYGYVY